MSFEVDFEPLGLRVPCEWDDTLLAAAQRAGIVLNATCGGEGACGSCIVQVMSGEVSPPNLIEEAELGDQVNDGWRLACQTKVKSGARVHIPPDSLATAQRTQTEGQIMPIELVPAVLAVEVELPQPSLDDLRSDASRMRDALAIPNMNIPLAVLQTLPESLRAHQFYITAYLRGDCLVGLGAAGTAILGLAVDLGTTKLAAYLVDLTSGETLASAGAMNPQIAFGEDVMARINHAISKPDGAGQLQAAVVEALDNLARDLCKQAGYSPSGIADAAVVGNTAMHHLLLGLPVRQLGLAPYVPAESGAVDIPASEIGFDFSPGANVHLLPNIAGFVGADHIAMLLGSGILEEKGILLGMDIGTNTEISLIAHGKHFTCSTASGPAFEGAHIQHGMRASPGAIERVLIQEGKIRLQTIDDQPPVGLCGSGILDLVAQLLRTGIINPRGAFTDANGSTRIRRGDHGLEYVLLDSAENDGREITFSRGDISEIQLAKGAMRTGVNILLDKAGINEDQIDKVFIAGAFGTYLDVQSGIDIGMFPNLPKSRFMQVGNAAGAGARMALLSKAVREKAEQLPEKITYVELTTEPSFSYKFAGSLLLEKATYQSPTSLPA